MQDRKIRILVIGGAFMAVFLVAILVTAPMGVVARIVEVQLEQALGHRYDIDIRRAAIRGPGTVVVRDIRITRRPEVNAQEDAPRPLPTEVDILRVRVGLLSLIRRQPRAGVFVRMDTGRMNLDVSPDGSGGSLVALRFDEFELRRVQPLRELIGLPVQGTVNGTVELTYDDRQRLQDGEIDLDIANTILGPGQLHAEAFRPFGGFIPLPATRFGRIVLDARIRDSDLEIDQFTADGTDVRLEVDGSAQLRDPMSATMIRLAISFSLNEAYVEEAGLSAALNMWPVLREAQTGDGYALILAGALGNLPEPQPLRGRSR